MFKLDDCLNLNVFITLAISPNHPTTAYLFLLSSKLVVHPFLLVNFKINKRVDKSKSPKTMKMG